MQEKDGTVEFRGICADYKRVVTFLIFAAFGGWMLYNDILEEFVIGIAFSTVWLLGVFIFSVKTFRYCLGHRIIIDAEGIREVSFFPWHFEKTVRWSELQKWGYESSGSDRSGSQYSEMFFIPAGDNLGEENRKKRSKKGIHLEFRECRRMRRKIYQIEEICGRYTAIEKVDMRNQ